MAEVNTASLLSSTEIDALLSIFNTDETRDIGDIRFEASMQKVATQLEHYLNLLGIEHVTAVVSPLLKGSETLYLHQPHGHLLSSVAIATPLLLAIVGLKCGAGEVDFTLERTLTTLESELITAVCEEITYIVEKELERYLQQNLSEISEHPQRVVLQVTSQSLPIELHFQKALSQVQEPKEAVVIPEDETIVEAILGTLDVVTMDSGNIYKVIPFEQRRSLLLLDKSATFYAKQRVQKSKTSYTLEASAPVELLKDCYYICVAKVMIQDALLLKLDYSTTLTLSLNKQVEVHKDGRIVANANITMLDGVMFIKVI